MFGTAILPYGVCAPRFPRDGVCYNAAVNRNSSMKLAIVAVVVILFAGVVLRAAMRLASVAMHSLFVTILLAVCVVWFIAKLR